MEEKVLIRRCVSEDRKKIFKIIIFSLLAISVLFLILWIGKTQGQWKKNYEDNYFYLGSSRYRCCICGETLLSGNGRLKSHIRTHSFSSFFRYIAICPELKAFAVLHWVFLFLAGVMAFRYFELSHCTITITDSNSITSTNNNSQNGDSNNLDDLVNLKDLLDNDVITQEEFDEIKNALSN